MGTTDFLLKRLERELRPIARERIGKGQLPHDAPTRFWRGFGNGQPCSLCDKPIQRDEIEYKIKPIEAAVQPTRFHRICRYAWQLECERVKQRPRPIRRKTPR